MCLFRMTVRKSD